MTQDSKGRKIGYWVATALTAFAIGAGGVFDAMAPPEVVALIEALGYPAYVLHLIGVLKVLGAITILIPKFPRLKEWAYAGITIDLVGASYSHAANGDAIKDVITPLVILVIALASWWLRPADRKLPDAR